MHIRIPVNKYVFRDNPLRMFFIDIKLTVAYSIDWCCGRVCFSKYYEAGRARVNRPVKSRPQLPFPQNREPCNGATSSRHTVGLHFLRRCLMPENGRHSGPTFGGRSSQAAILYER
jgi:hypothetical protein